MSEAVTGPDGVTQMEWRSCAGLPDYEVSECGDVRRAVSSRTRRLGWRLRGFVDADGYLRYQLLDSEGQQQVVIASRLVALAFIGPAPSARHAVAHKNGSRVHNHFSNLRWALPVENHADRIVHGTAPIGSQNGNAKLSDADVIAIRSEYRAIKERRKTGRICDLAARYSVNHGTIVRIASGKAWRHILGASQ